VSIELASSKWLLLLAALPAWWWWTRPLARWGVLVARDEEARVGALSPWLAAFLESVPRLLRAAGAACLVLALADPRLVRIYEEPVRRSSAVVVALDLSTSMWAQDMAQGTTRLQAAKAAVKGFLDRHSEGEVGLVSFAGEAHVRLPLTADRYVAHAAVDALEVGLLLDGTDIASAIAVGAALLRESAERDRILILVTDGAHNKVGLVPALAARAAAAFDVRIFAIAIGSDDLLRSAVTGMETVLTQAAAITRGVYFRATDARALERIYEEIEKLAAGTEELVSKSQPSPLAHWFVLASLVCFVAAVALRASRWGVVP
jgi:Ca-activated chloride channel family protein